MNIENQFCSLELAKKLKEIGIEQRSIFVWEYYNDQCYGIKFIPYAVVPNEINKFQLFSAFSASELGYLLPNRINKPNQAPFDNYRLVIRKFISVDENMIQTNNFIVNYETEMAGPDAWLTRNLNINIYEKNLANAMAKMLIYLLENGLIENAQD